MQINVTFRHVNPTPALRAHAEEKLERMVKKYLRRPVDAHVILSVAKERHAAEVTLQADHVTMFAKEETTDLYAAIDLAVEKLEHQAQKLRAKRKEHKGPSAAVRTQVAEDAAPSRGAASRPRVIPRRVSAKPMGVDEALETLARTGDEFLVFTNAASQTLAVLYRRKDGNYGLIEPEGR
ncbi:MAG TPA: ribosome-associated translation inhibitor RaiA [Candidatus Eisenbacteria bacterium]|nr:ribosome-associated translation inhibitor RaiA [Candidatus Eisenbacteria bacterium]